MAKRMKKLKSALNPNQSKLQLGETLKLTDRREKAPPFIIDEVTDYMCPFCLHIDKQKAFLLYKDDKLITYRAKCPECEQTFLMKTLTNNMSVVEFADWVAGYVHSGFWSKCSFEIFSKRLHDYGWNRLFWERYRAKTGSYDEHKYNRILEDAKRGNEDDIGRYGR